MIGSVAIERSDGPTNMARDCELLVEAERGIAGVRYYEWDGAWVSLGRYQRADRDLLQPDAIRWVMRPTGGKAVLHGHDLTVSIAAPLADLGAGSRNVRAIYRKVIEPIVSGLRRVGVDAALGEEADARLTPTVSADCFLQVSPNDIMDLSTGTKLVGCALRVTECAVLAQCSIPIREPLIDPAIVFRVAHVPQPRQLEASHLAQRISQELTAMRCFA